MSETEMQEKCTQTSDEESGSDCSSIAESPTSYEQLPNAVKRRVSALKKLHFEKKRIDEKFMFELLNLKTQFDSDYEPLFKKRCNIVTGAHEPLDSELCEDSYFEAIPSEFLGIPNFWLKVLQNCEYFTDMIKEYDEPILTHLMDVRVRCDTQLKKFSLELQFSSNDYFTNEVLVKEMYFTSDPKGEEIIVPISSVSTQIAWNSGKDVTLEVFGETSEESMAFKEKDSFFQFFWTSPKKEAMSSTQEALDEDWGLIQLLFNEVIPNAVVLYAKEKAMEVEESSDEEESSKSSEEVMYK